MVGADIEDLVLALKDAARSKEPRSFCVATAASKRSGESARAWSDCQLALVRLDSSCAGKVEAD